MILPLRGSTLLLVCLTLGAMMKAEETEMFKAEVREGFGKYVVKAEAPLPKEIKNEEETQNLAKEAALAAGQNALLSHLLTKRTRSGKTLAEAQIPSLDLQNDVKDVVKQAKPMNVVFTRQNCKLTLVLSKSAVKKILKRN